MHIKHIELSNWCQHHKLSINLGPGLNGVIGSNGKGKSNFLDAIRFAFTGESENPGGKADNLRWGAKGGHVKIDVAFGDTDYEIFRSIKTPKAWMKWKDATGGENTLTKVAEIEEMITRLTGASSNALLDAVFVPQGKIDAVLFQRQSDRLKDFQRIFGLEVTADIYRYLGEEINLYRLTPGLAQTLKETGDLLAGSRAELAIIEGEVAELTAAVGRGAGAEDVIKRQIAAAQHATATSQAAARVAAAEARLTEARGVLAPIEEAAAAVDLDALRAEATRTQAAAFALSTAGSDWTRAENMRAELEAAKQRRDAAITDPVTPEDMAALQQADTSLAQTQAWASGQRDPMPSELKAQQDHRYAQEALNRLKSHGSPTLTDDIVAGLTQQIEHIRREIGGFESGVCPTCGQEVQGGPDAIAAKLKEVDALVSRRDARCASIEEAYRADVAAAEAALGTAWQVMNDIADRAREFFRQKWETAKTNRDALAAAIQHRNTVTATREAAERRVAELEAGLIGAPETQPTPEAIQAARAAEKAAADAVEQAREVLSALTQARNVVGFAEQALGEAKAAEAALSVVLDVPSAEEVAAAQATLEIVSQERQLLAAKQNALLAVKVAVANREQEVDRLSKQLRAEAKEQAWVEALRVVRDAMHPSKLPAIVMGEYAKILNSQIGWYLAQWQAPFQFWINEDLAFRAIKPMEADPDCVAEMDAARLSGGEKIVASTSYRLGMSDTFARNAGLIVLDEPSNYLDKKNIKNLQEVLLQLRALSAASHRQIIVVTHEQSLVGFFDHTVQIGEDAALAA
jgi:DNA repair exonuclease SbcCD ATPase subunit